MRIEELGFGEWEDALPRDGFDVFHTREALQVMNEHTSSDLHLLGGFKGQQRIGLAPIFVREHGVGRLVTSPPPGLGVGRLGTIVTPTSPKQRKIEEVTREFTERLIEATDASEKSTLFRMSCGTWCTDPRPFGWAGFNVIPSFTYRLNLESTTSDEVMSSFSRDRRKEARNRNESGIVIRINEKSGAERVYDSMIDRYEEQGLDVPLSKEFVLELVAGLGERARVYTAESEDGEFLSGMIILYSNDTAYNWKGGTKSSKTRSGVSPNSLLHWQIIEDILTDPDLESILEYDLYTANDERLVRYKSSFGGNLVPYYTIESNGLPLKFAKGVYRMAALKKDPFGNRSLGSVKKNLPPAPPIPQFIKR
ncbi:GNAT family N-acetyltransferase [Natronorarus salvus]|uniref:GNAT family N-acetyltransferase n=1 Tax=Natronorarus salvus TaxID=3117733 RepID=UPI002F26B0ED